MNPMNYVEDLFNTIKEYNSNVEFVS
jgi:hypothetical protein